MRSEGLWKKRLSSTVLALDGDNKFWLVIRKVLSGGAGGVGISREAVLIFKEEACAEAASIETLC